MKGKTTGAAVLLSAIFLFAGCAPVSPSSGAESGEQSSVSLTQYTAPLDIHTEKQRAYLRSGNPASLSEEIDGKTEYSLPQSVKLSWTNSEECNSYTVTISESSDFTDKRILYSTEPSVEVYNLKIATTYYWKVTENKKDGTTSATGSFETVDYGPRNLYVDGVTNVRDAGGWKTESGGRTVQGLLFRGGRLNNSYPDGWVKGGDDTGYEFEAEITDEGVETFVGELNIKTEIDFRTRDRNGYPGTTDKNEQLYSAAQGVQYISVPMDGNADINSNKGAIKQFFETIAKRENYPVYYHCNIGTDRTGMITYLLNALCGVGEQDLYYDYMFSDFGLIALSSPQVSNPARKELSELTTGSGAAARVASYAGDTLAQKARACLKDCGINDSTLNAVYNIMTGK